MAFLGSRALGVVLLALQAAASPVILQRQYWPDPEAAAPTLEKCLDRSFSNPGWGIYSPQLVTVNGSSGGTQGDIRFQAINSANGVTADCRAQNIELDPRTPAALAVWHNCSLPDLQFQFSLPTLDMNLRGSWVCDASSKLSFSANGSWVSPLIQGCLDDWQAPRGEEILCIMGNSQVAGSLSHPVNIAPQLPLLPYTAYEPPSRCVDRSVDPEWQIENLLYRHHSKQSGGKTEKTYNLSLDLTNISNGDKVACNTTVDELKSVDPKGSIPWAKCSPVVGSQNTSMTTSSEIMLDTTHGVLGVRQSWYCTDGILGIDPDNFTGVAYLTNAIECGSPVNLAAYGSDGLVVSATSNYNCTLAAPASGDGIHRFSGYWPAAPSMPHTSYAHSCTIGSVVNTTSLTLREYQIETVAPAQLVGTFTLVNPGPGDIYRLAGIPVVDDGVWRECVAGKDGALPWQLVGCQYSLNRQTRQVGFKVKWYCDDRDPSHPILFDATATIELPAEKCDTVTTNGEKKESCRLPLGVGDVKLPVTDLSWKTTSTPMDRGPTLPWI
ncbi:hypothetical protein B0T25DRAFT_614369 [Lasiosphaeria hispida]|uniref:Ig-like domain-containing protein n=1 Tax=Lasiosphaeria hispida TaxID=260671 RepID=A0AAJ0H8D8_9PEZI|nr:hypothetical protein B0T25DRAFT_614369 [Lasiosphaeria hispida]